MSLTGGKNTKGQKPANAEEITEVTNIRTFTPEASLDETKPAFRTGSTQNKGKR